MLLELGVNPQAMLEDKPSFCMFNMAVDTGKERIVAELLKKIRAGEFERR